jgi:predicted DNA-binding protein
MGGSVHRTTIRMDEHLYKEARKLGLELSQDFQTIVHDAVEAYLPALRKETINKNTRLKTLKLGKYNGLSRNKMYED